MSEISYIFGEMEMGFGTMVSWDVRHSIVELLKHFVFRFSSFGSLVEHEMAKGDFVKDE